MSFQFHWNPMGFLQTLPIMLYGMLGIFAVMLILYFSIVILLKIFSRPQKSKE